MEWISVEDKLPESFKHVLLTDGIKISEGYLDEAYGIFDDIHRNWNADSPYLSLGNITYWMPLPKIPTK